MSRPRLAIGVTILLGLTAALAWVLLSPRTPGRIGATPTTSPDGQAITSPAPSAEPSPTGTDWETIARELQQLGARAFTERRPELIDEINTPGCPCYAQAKSYIQDELIAKGLRWLGYSQRVVKVSLAGQPAPDRADVRIWTEGDPYELVDERGEVVKRLRGWVGEQVMLHLTYVADRGRWMVGLLVVERPGNAVPSG